MKWQERKLGEVIEVNRKSIDHKYPFKEIRYIDTSSATEGRIERVQYLALEEAPSRAKRIVSNNDIIYSTVRPNLKHYALIKQASPNLIASTGYAVITCTEEAEPGFIYAFLTTEGVIDYLHGIAEGQAATFPAFNIEALEKLKIPLPPLPIQRKIAAVLGRYDTLLENYQGQIAALEAMVQELYREWFVRGRCPGAEAGPNGELPEGWEIKKFTDAISVLSGGTPTTSEPNYWDGDIYWFSPGDTGNSCYVLTTEKTITELGLKNCNSKLYPVNTVVITARGTVGKCVLLGRPMAINQSNYALVGKSVSQYFTYFKTLELAESLQQEANGAVFSTITTNNFERADIVVPDAKSLSAFDQKVTPLFQAIRNHLLQSEILRATRDALLPRLLSGQLLPTIAPTF